MMTAALPKVAFFDFTCCEGCQLTVVDALQTHLDLLSVIEIVNFREAISEKGEDYQIAFIEGSCTRPSDEDRLRHIREQASLVVALGACSHLGGVNTIRNRMDLDDVRNYVYGDKAEWFDTYPARPIDKVIKVDAIIPGCPIDREEFVRFTKMLLQGRVPQLPEEPVCVSCKLKDNQCVYELGKVCLGPITRQGCDAVCTSNRESCIGCRGMVTYPNIASMNQVMLEHGMEQSEVDAVMGMFLTYQLDELESEKV
jgi:sulfhydrogenase subunit delta